jgi:arsenate reductase (thioredoxin)
LAGPSHYGSLGVPDPAAVEGPAIERMKAFRAAYRVLDARIKLFAALPIEKLDNLALKRETAQIGRIGTAVDAETEV